MAKQSSQPTIQLKKFELDPSLPSAEAARKVTLELLENATVQLLEEPDGRKKAVHEFRKNMKKARAVARLFRPHLGKEYKKSNHLLRDAARELSEARDASALRATVAQLSEYESESESNLRDALRQLNQALQLLEESSLDHDLESRKDRALFLLKKARKRVERWDMKSFSGLPGGLEKTYRRAFQQFCLAENGERDTLHEWRKRTKYHRYHLRLLRPVFRPVLKSERKLAKSVSNILGDDHDLQNIQELLHSLEEFGLAPAGMRVLDEFLCHRRTRLQREALHQANLLFAEKPKARGKRLDAYVRATQKRLR